METTTVFVLLALAAVVTCVADNCVRICFDTKPTSIDVKLREPIPTEIKAKLAGRWYFAQYSHDDDVQNADDLCVQVTCELNDLDVLYLDFVFTYVQSGQPEEAEHYAGVRVDNGASTQYKWLQEKGGDNATYTLLSATHTYAVFVSQNTHSNGDPTQTSLVVFSTAKTLSPDVLAAIEKIQKDNGINEKLTPAQNKNCPD